MTASGKILTFTALGLIACSLAAINLPAPAQAQVQVEVQVQVNNQVEAPVDTQIPAKETAADILPYKYTGNLYSRKFHRPRCPYSRVMSESKRVRFHFRCQAVAQGYVPCRYCLPPVWTTVRATIKYQDFNKICPQIDQREKVPPSKQVNPANDAPLGTAIGQPNISTP